MRPEDGSALQEIELLAGAQFREIGMVEVAEHEPAAIEVLVEYATAGRSWVAVADDQVVGYLLVDVVDGNVHIEQVSVRPDRQGQGIGRALLDRAGAWALAAGCATLTLTTFGHVPWNRPLYEHLGFRVLADEEVGTGLRRVREHEITRGLDPATRVCMGLDLGRHRITGAAAPPS